ncbi:translation initiation factor IF-1 [Burkholderia sp. SRS-46]|nr:translation initiation factor IF-1 [Burkholderia sp. SRS-46]
MVKEELLELDGIVDEVLPDSRYRVTLDNGVVEGAYASGRIRKHHIRILAGDRVTPERSAYDLTRGRIDFRRKNERSGGATQRPAFRRRRWRDTRPSAVTLACATTLRAHPHHHSPLPADLNQGKN